MDTKGGSETLPSVETFQNLVPLENLQQMSMPKSSSFGYQSSVYKADNSTNGTYACLHRIHGFRLVINV
jgi:PAB-dependent poly(A)-specific ribonuclease subunit 3